MFDLKKVCSNFQILGDFLDAAPYGSGHINDTFLVRFNQGGCEIKYIIQRINHKIFKDPVRLMDNISRVTCHSQNKLKEKNGNDVSRKSLIVIKSIDDRNYYLDEQGNYWRGYIFIDKAQTYDVMQNLEQAYQAAKAFGEFQNLLVDLPGGPLFETIPNFHNGQMRYAAFEAALKKDEHNRAKTVQKEIEFLQRNGGIFDIFPKLIADGLIPVRTTHNDTKINNVMLDNKTGEGICVIDLDTVMPGIALYDFGDIVRTSVCPAAEDEQDLTKVFAVPERFEAIIKGYLASAGKFLNKTERQHLVFGGIMITLIIGTRFLTDYLSGDVYFKIKRQGHNIDRCRTQFKIVQSILDQQEKIEKIVQRQT